MKRDYDETIVQHYQRVADQCGLSSTSTMADAVTRERETYAIVRCVEEYLTARGADAATIMDVGCGNGFTLSVLAEMWPGQRYLGIEQSEGLRSLAITRFQSHDSVRILEGDIRDANFAGQTKANILICQRVLINLLDRHDQRAALANIVNATRPGGTLVFIEAFSSPLARLNDARAEFDLPPIPPAHHNLYLDDEFFAIPDLKRVAREGSLAPNMLSTHYYVARVLHPLICGARPFKRNSEFVKFFSEALKPNVGDYSPLKLHVFEKTGPA